MNPLEYAATRAEWRSPFLDVYANLNEKPWLKWCFKNDLCANRHQRRFVCTDAMFVFMCTCFMFQLSIVLLLTNADMFNFNRFQPLMNADMFDANLTIDCHNVTVCVPACVWRQWIASGARTAYVTAARTTGCRPPCLARKRVIRNRGVRCAPRTKHRSGAT